MSIQVKAESVVSYLGREVSKLCEEGHQVLTLQEVTQILRSAKTRETGCQVFDLESFDSISESGFQANDGYQGPLAVIKLIDNKKTSINSAVISLRDQKFCMNTEGDVTRIAYSLSSNDTSGALRILGEKIHTRKVMFELVNGELTWVGQYASNYERSGIRYGSASSTFQCGH